MNAAWISINFETGDVMWTMFDDGKNDNPIMAASALKLGIEDDWPGYEWFVVGDEEARKLNAEILVGERFAKDKEDGDEKS